MIILKHDLTEEFYDNLVDQMCGVELHRLEYWNCIHGWKYAIPHPDPIKMLMMGDEL